MDFLQRQVWAVPGIWKPGGLQSFSPGSEILFPHVILSRQYGVRAGVLTANWVLKTNAIAPSHHHNPLEETVTEVGGRMSTFSARKQIQTGFDQECWWNFSLPEETLKKKPHFFISAASKSGLASPNCRVLANSESLYLPIWEGKLSCKDR